MRCDETRTNKTQMQNSLQESHRENTEEIIILQ